MFKFRENKDWDKDIFTKDFLNWFDEDKPESNFEEIYEYERVGQFLICEELFPREDTIRGEDRRWSVWIDIVYKIGDRYFMTGYDYGLTEYQENEFYDTDVVEVGKKIIVKVDNEWIEKLDIPTKNGIPYGL